MDGTHSSALVRLRACGKWGANLPPAVLVLLAAVLVRGFRGAPGGLFESLLDTLLRNLFSQVMGAVAGGVVSDRFLERQLTGNLRQQKR